MSGNHWTKDEIIGHVYGLATREDSHLEQCPECASEWSRIMAIHDAIHGQQMRPTDVPADFLAAQRRKIYTRMGHNPVSPARLLWAPTLAAGLCVLAAGLFLHQPKVAPPPIDPADAQFFSEVYSMEQRAEPRAAAPIHELFEGGQ